MSESDLIHVMMKWQQTFDEHTKEESIRYNTIVDEIKKNTKYGDENNILLSNKIDRLADSLKEHADAVKLQQGEVTKQLHDAIPDKDFVGHGQLFIKNKEELRDRRAINFETRKKVFSGTVVGGLLILGYALLEYFKAWMLKS